MGCLSGCFGRGKNRRRQRRRESFQPRLTRISEEFAKDDHLNVRVSTVEEVPKISVIPITDICDKAEEKRSPRPKAKAYEHIVAEVSVKISNKTEEKYTDSKVKTVDHIAGEEPVKVSDKTKEECSPSPTRKRVTFDSKVKTYEHIEFEETVELLEEKKEEFKSSQTQCSSENSDITSNSSGSYPSNHRYQNCRESDDEAENETDCGESDLDEDNEFLHDEFYSDDDKFEDNKLQKWGKEVYTEEIADNVLDIDAIQTKTKGSNANARDRSGYVHAVLNPVENLTQWKAVKSKGRTIHSQLQKENANLISDQEDEEFSAFSFRPKSKDETNKKQRNQEVAVDASLSTWLSTTTSSCSSISVGVVTATTETKYTSSYSKP